MIYYDIYHSNIGSYKFYNTYFQLINTIKKFVSIKMIELLEIKLYNSNYKFHYENLFTLSEKGCVIHWKATFADKVKLVILVHICNIMI